MIAIPLHVKEFYSKMSRFNEKSTESKIMQTQKRFCLPEIVSYLYKTNKILEDKNKALNDLVKDSIENDFKYFAKELGFSIDNCYKQFVKRTIKTSKSFLELKFELETGYDKQNRTLGLFTVFESNKSIPVIKYLLSKKRIVYPTLYGDDNFYSIATGVLRRNRFKDENEKRMCMEVYLNKRYNDIGVDHRDIGSIEKILRKYI